MIIAFCRLADTKVSKNTDASIFSVVQDVWVCPILQMQEVSFPHKITPSIILQGVVPRKTNTVVALIMNIEHL
jgi:hypothetical protein